MAGPDTKSKQGSRLRFLLLAGAAGLLSCRPPDSVTTAAFESHNLDLTITVENQKAVLNDRGTVRVQPGWNLFQIARTAQISEFRLNHKPVPVFTFQPADSADLPAALQSRLPAGWGPWEQQLVCFRTRHNAVLPFELSYAAVYAEAVENVRFSREQVGREVTGTILAQGAYLSPSAYFYPRGDDGLMDFALQAAIPGDWESICDGNRLSSEIHAGQNIQSWRNPYKSEGLMFMAAPYVTRSSRAEGVEINCYFFAADTGLVDTYLEATAGYIRMYSELIGPYPFERFTVAENFFPTGYGMPAWTLLGQQVLRLPFIVRTSLGHEVLHNWWGNSVYVDAPRGNWCEAATTYGADYRYQVLKSPEAARDYRKDILKQYASYVTDKNDFPIRKFTSRTSPDTRTIGYNKAMLVYHMIAGEIGEEAFFEAWKLVYQRYRGQKIAWEEWLQVFEETSGKSLAHIIPQWIEQPGAADLELELLGLDTMPYGPGRTATLELRERSGRYSRLAVPVRIDGPAPLDTTLLLTGSSRRYNLPVPAGAHTLAVDPDFHLFRRLHPQELEPIIAAVLGAPQKVFIACTGGLSERGFFQAFGHNLTEDTVEVGDPAELATIPSTAAPVLLNPDTLPDDLAGQVRLSADSVALGGQAYPRAGHTFILTGRDWRGFKRYLVILTGAYDALPRLGQLIPHYGKYSFLVFEGTRNIGKGQWPVTASPLRKALPVAARED